MKNIKKYLIMLLFVFILCACGKKISLFESDKMINPDDNITINIESEKDQLKIDITNNTDNDTVYFFDWFLEKFDNKWMEYAVQIDRHFTDELTLKKKETISETIKITEIENIYGKLHSGQYRIIILLNNQWYGQEFTI